MKYNSINNEDIQQILCNYLIDNLSQEEIFELGFFILRKHWDKNIYDYEDKFSLKFNVINYYRSMLISSDGAEDIGKYAIYLQKDDKNKLYIVDINDQEIREKTREDHLDFSKELQKYEDIN